MIAQAHSERKHAKLSASGAERWFRCPGSPALSEGTPDRESEAAKEGTAAHELLEAFFTQKGLEAKIKAAPPEMYRWVKRSVDIIEGMRARARRGHEFIIEKKVELNFISPEMWGSIDYGIIEHFGTLHVIDFKFGKKLVSPVENLQLLYYSLGLAHLYHWNFKKVRLTIIQPRARQYDGPSFWELPIVELKRYVAVFNKAVKRVHDEPKTYVEGNWCFFCKAQRICPLKQNRRKDGAKALFMSSPMRGMENGKN